jgi:hypothetical protein
MFGVGALFNRPPTSYSIAETTLRGRSRSRIKCTFVEELECMTPFEAGAGRRIVTELLDGLRERRKLLPGPGRRRLIGSKAF